MHSRTRVTLNLVVPFIKASLTLLPFTPRRSSAACLVLRSLRLKVSTATSMSCSSISLLLPLGPLGDISVTMKPLRSIERKRHVIIIMMAVCCSFRNRGKQSSAQSHDTIQRYNHRVRREVTQHRKGSHLRSTSCAILRPTPALRGAEDMPGLKRIVPSAGIEGGVTCMGPRKDFGLWKEKLPDVAAPAVSSASAASVISSSSASCRRRAMRAGACHDRENHFTNL